MTFIIQFVGSEHWFFKKSINRDRSAIHKSPWITTDWVGVRVGFPPGLYGSSMAGIMAQFGAHDSLAAASSMMPPNIPLAWFVERHCRRKCWKRQWPARLVPYTTHDALTHPLRHQLRNGFRYAKDSIDSSGRRPQKSRPNHSLIENDAVIKWKRTFSELAALVPMCAAINSNKLDKFTVLRLAFQHIKSHWVVQDQPPAQHHCISPLCLDEEIKQLMKYSNMGLSWSPTVIALESFYLTVYTAHCQAPFSGETKFVIFGDFYEPIHQKNYKKLKVLTC